MTLSTMSCALEPFKTRRGKNICKSWKGCETRQGAQGIIEGCTEIVLLVQQHHTDIPLFDTTSIHAKAAVKYSLAEK